MANRVRQELRLSVLPHQSEGVLVRFQCLGGISKTPFRLAELPQCDRQGLAISRLPADLDRYQQVLLRVSEALLSVSLLCSVEQLRGGMWHGLLNRQHLDEALAELGSVLRVGQGKLDKCLEVTLVVPDVVAMFARPQLHAHHPPAGFTQYADRLG